VFAELESKTQRSEVLELEHSHSQLHCHCGHQNFSLTLVAVAFYYTAVKAIARSFNYQARIRTALYCEQEHTNRNMKVSVIETAKLLYNGEQPSQNLNSASRISAYALAFRFGLRRQTPYAHGAQITVADGEYDGDDVTSLSKSPQEIPSSRLSLRAPLSTTMALSLSASASASPSSNCLLGSSSATQEKTSKVNISSFVKHRWSLTRV